MAWTGSSQAGLIRMLSYSAPAASRSAVGCKPCDLVGWPDLNRRPLRPELSTQANKSAG